MTIALLIANMLAWGVLIGLLATLIRANRRAHAFDQHVDEALLLVTDTPTFDAVVAAMPEVAERSVVDEAEAILRSAGGWHG